ncbi:MAG: DHH family phosphoesterase [Oscillospiraceae bacterium]|nr:DHH family phosphoesterase [Oscillospiraceae bacterium]
MKKKKLVLLYLSILLLISLPAYSAYRLYSYEENESFFFLCLTVITIFIVLTQIISAKQNLYRYFNRIEHGLNQAKCYALFNTPDPIVILDAQDTVLWYNQSFYDCLTDSTDVFGINICSALNISDELVCSGKDFEIDIHGQKYSIHRCSRANYGTTLNIFFMKDITDYSNLLQEYNDKKPTVALIAVDNYEDIFANAKESDKARVQAAVEKLLEQLVAGSNSLLKRLSKDRFIAVFEEEHLNQIIKDRFKILDNARSISVNEGSYITLSIGVGKCSSSLAESEEFARQSLDMALGRGGDQAAVKTENGFEFFGGISKGVEKHSRIKTRIISNAMQKLIENSSQVFVMGHRFADLDSVGASIGLSTAINMLGTQSYVLINTEENLAKPLVNRVMDQDYCRFIDENTALAKADKDSLLIILDTHRQSLIESKALYEKIKNVIIIDHHRKNIDFIDNAVIFYHEPYASSTSEMVTEVIQYFKKLSKIPCYSAEALLAGIMLDTKNFVVKTGVRTFEAAAYLKKMGADTIAVRELFANSIDLYRVKSRIVSSAQLYGGFAIACVCPEDSIDDSIRIIAPQASDELLNISNVSASFVIFKTGDVVNISARSYGAVNVQLIMEKINGGGHQNMAAAQLTGAQTEDAREILLEAIEEYKNENKKN